MKYDNKIDKEKDFIDENVNIEEKWLLKETPLIKENYQGEEYNHIYSEANLFNQKTKTNKTLKPIKLLQAVSILMLFAVVVVANVKATYNSDIKILNVGTNAAVYSFNIDNSITDEELSELEIHVYNDFFEYIEKEIYRGEKAYIVENLEPNNTYKIELRSSTGPGVKTIASTEFTSLNNDFDLLFYNIRYSLVDNLEQYENEEFYALQYDVYVNDPNEMIKEVLFYYEETFEYEGLVINKSDNEAITIDLASSEKIITSFYHSSFVKYYIEVTYYENDIEKIERILEDELQITMKPEPYAYSGIDGEICYMGASVSFMGNNVTSIKLDLIQNEKIIYSYDILSLGTIENMEYDKYVYWENEIESNVLDVDSSYELKVYIEYEYLNELHVFDKVFIIEPNNIP